MAVKKLRTIFMRYILLVACGIILIGAINIGAYMFCVNTNVIVPTVKIDEEISNASEKLKTSNELDFNDIPFFCEYSLFSEDGNLENSSLETKKAKSFWGINILNHKDSERPYRYKTIDRGNEILILRYRIASQFKNDMLRNFFPVADIPVLIIAFIEMIALLIFVSHLFGKYTGGKIRQLLVVTQKIEEHDLDFTVNDSGIFEINEALKALEHMKNELKKSLMAQWKADKIQQEQISALAHDLKTPLTILRGNAELLYDTELMDKQKECADYIMNSYEQMYNYVQILIDVTKSKIPLSFSLEQMKIAEILKEAKINVKGLCAVKNITLKWNEDYNTIYILADKEQLLRAILNIASNAVDYTPDNGNILFDVYEDIQYFNIAISDTGTGFSPESLKRAKEQFYMGDNSRTSGTHYGMGLYITNTIIKQHNGQLLLDNSVETHGAKVIIQIPLNTIWK